MERIGTALFNFICIDAFQSVETANPQVNEKRRRERAILLAYGAWMLLWMLAYLSMPSIAPASPEQPGFLLSSILQSASAGAFGIGTLAGVTALWLHSSYISFRFRRWLDENRLHTSHHSH